jgi:hypothetical protein
MGTDMYECCYPAVEIPVKEFIMMEGGPEAIEKELTAMRKRRFNAEKHVPDHLKRSALECRLICTQKRDSQPKARLVAKDLKARRKLPDTSTYAAVPAMYGVRLLIAAADGRAHIISTTDFDVAYLQAENRADEDTWLLIKYRDPKTGEWVYVWLMGCIYGEQQAGKSWKDSLCHKMVMVGGFKEVLNMENMYYHPIWRVAVAIHVDDPIVFSRDEMGYTKTHDFLDQNFDTKGRQRLTQDHSIDYLSMELTLTPEYDITLTNRAKCLKLLEDAGMQDILPTTMPPMTKATLKAALADDEPLTPAQNSVRLADNGRFGWLSQTTHIGLAVATSIAQGLKPTQGTRKVSHMMYQWVRAHLDDGLLSKCDDYSGLSVSSDADWAGMHSVNGEIRSRTGMVIMYNGTPVLWYTGLQKTTSSQWVDGTEPTSEPAIARSSGNAELIAASDTLTRALHFTFVSEELNIAVPRPIVVDLDASAALGFLHNTGGGGKMKHIDIREGWVQQIRDKGTVTFNKVDGKLIPANFMTKLLERLEYNHEYQRLALVGKPAEADPELDEDERSK